MKVPGVEESWVLRLIMWPESDQTESKELELWQRYVLARGVGSSPLGETGSFPKGVSDQTGYGAQSPAQPEPLGP